jgi:hypothetical protein
MFSKTITNSSQFLMMPQSSQNLYFHLGMNADDDGFCEHFTIMRMTESKPDDLKILQAKGFINLFDDKVLVIIDWKENNYLRSDRYTPSKYLEVYKEEIQRLTSGIPEVDKVATQDRIGKDRIGKDTNTSDKSQKYNPLGSEIIKAFEEVDPKNKTYYGNKTQRASCDFLLSEYGLENVLKAIKILPQINRKKLYIKQITTPFELKENWVKIGNALKQTTITKKVAF